MDMFQFYIAIMRYQDVARQAGRATWNLLAGHIVMLFKMVCSGQGDSVCCARTIHECLVPLQKLISLVG